jgi:ferrous iron transport protein B
LFNALTGLRARVGNYAGVTVERKEGRLLNQPKESPIAVLDLPGTYSLSPQSLDEEISRDVLFHRLGEVPAPDLVVVVVDASNLQRNLYYATQIIELGYPTVIALNMLDVAETNGLSIDTARLSDELGAPVVPLVASSGRGVTQLRETILSLLKAPVRDWARSNRLFCELRSNIETELETITDALVNSAGTKLPYPPAESLLLLGEQKDDTLARYPAGVQRAVHGARERLRVVGVDWRSASIEARYASIARIESVSTVESAVQKETFSDKLDRVLTHKVWGMLIFVGIMAFMFQSIFTFAQLPMKALEKGVAWVGVQVGHVLPPGDLHSLLVDGVIAGVGAVVVFLPQICLLFLFISLLEDTGYMARAAFLMDRLMSKVGLHGKSFIPMLSSFACAIPGIMATRTIESPKDRLVTILVAPLMSCSARLPVYTLLIAACIPNLKVVGWLRLPGLTMLAMYLLGILGALAMAWLFKKTLLKGPVPMLIMELPPYKRPVLAVVARHMWDRSKLFLRRAGTVILGISILLWFLVSYPRNSAVQTEFAQQRAAVRSNIALANNQAATGQQLEELDRREAGEKLRHSFAGRLGHLLEPAIAPLGFDWKIGIGIVASFAAREVFVSTMSTVYNLGGADTDEPENAQNLAQTLREQKRPDGTPIYTPLVAAALMVFYVFALQCVSTVAVVRRETNSWRWPVFQWAYMGALAWVLAFLTYQGGKLMGWD